MTGTLLAVLTATCALWLTITAHAAPQSADGSSTVSPRSLSKPPVAQTTPKSTDGTLNPSPQSLSNSSPTKFTIPTDISLEYGQPTGPINEPFDSNAPPKAAIPLGFNLFWGGYGSFEGETNRNYRLSSTLREADSTLKPVLAPAFAYEPTEDLQLYVNPVLEIPVEVEGIIDKSQTTEINMNLAFVTVKNVVPGSRLQVGRQRFIDSRRWLFNENMDAIRLGYQYENFTTELSVSQLNMVQRNLLRRKGEPSEETLINYYWFADYKFGKKNHIGLFALYQDQQRQGTQQPIFAGLQSG